MLVQGSVSHKEETDFVPSVLEATSGFQVHVKCDLTCSLAAGLRTHRTGPGPGRWRVGGWSCDPGNLA